MITLSKRLQAVADLVKPVSTIADIGCDHGFMSIYLIQSNRCEHVIAMDVNEGPLLRAKEHILEHALQNQIETRLSDGGKALLLQDFEKEGKQIPEAQGVIMAGMGGRLMTKILQDSKAVFGQMEQWILQPQSEPGLVRKTIRDLGFSIEEENMVLEDGKYYGMLRAVPRSLILEETQNDSCPFHQDVLDQYGTYLIQNGNPCFLDFLQYQINQTKQILENLQGQQSERTLAAKENLQEKLQLFIRLQEFTKKNDN